MGINDIEAVERFNYGGESPTMIKYIEEQEKYIGKNYASIKKTEIDNIVHLLKIMREKEEYIKKLENVLFEMNHYIEDLKDNYKKVSIQDILEKWS